MATASSIGTLLKVDIASTLTTIAGVRNVDFKSPEVETYETDDLDDTYIGLATTGRTGGGSVSFSKFYDPAAATHATMKGLINSPAEKSFQIVWSDASTTSQDLDGILKSLNIKAERGDALMEDGEIMISSAPTLA